MQDADELHQQSQQVATRAKEVIAASEAASSRLRAGSGAEARPHSAPFLKGLSRLSAADHEHISSLEAQIVGLQSAVQVHCSIVSVLMLQACDEYNGTMTSQAL